MSALRDEEGKIEVVKASHTRGSGEGGVKGEGSGEARGLGVGEVGVHMRRWGAVAVGTWYRIHKNRLETRIPKGTRFPQSPVSINNVGVQLIIDESYAGQNKRFL